MDAELGALSDCTPHGWPSRRSAPQRGNAGKPEWSRILQRLSTSRVRARARARPTARAARWRPKSRDDKGVDTASGVSGVPDAEGGEVDALDGLEELAADAGREEVLSDSVGEVDPGHHVSRDRQVELGVGRRAGNAGEA
jgi:hypothetical protein